MYDKAKSENLPSIVMVPKDFDGEAHKKELEEVGFIGKLRLSNEFAKARAERVREALKFQVEAIKSVLTSNLEVIQKTIETDKNLRLGEIMAAGAELKSRLDEENLKKLEETLNNLGSTFEEGLKRMSAANHSDVVKEKNIGLFTAMYEKKFQELAELYNLK